MFVKFAGLLLKDKCANVTEYVTALCYLMIVESNTQICEVLKMKNLTKKEIIWLVLMIGMVFMSVV